MRTTLDLPDDLLKQAKIAAVERGSTLRELVVDSLRRALAEKKPAPRRRMNEAPVQLPPGHTIPVLSNQEVAELFNAEDIAHLHDVYRGR